MVCQGFSNGSGRAQGASKRNQWVPHGPSVLPRDGLVPPREPQGTPRTNLRSPKALPKAPEESKNVQGGGGQRPLTPPCISEVPSEVPEDLPKDWGRSLGPSKAGKSCGSCRILMVPADSLISNLLKHHAISLGYGGHARRLQYMLAYIYIYIWHHLS